MEKRNFCRLFFRKFSNKHNLPSIYGIFVAIATFPTTQFRSFSVHFCEINRRYIPSVVIFLSWANAAEVWQIAGYGEFSILKGYK